VCTVQNEALDEARVYNQSRGCPGGGSSFQFIRVMCGIYAPRISARTPLLPKPQCSVKRRFRPALLRCRWSCYPDSGKHSGGNDLEYVASYECRRYSALVV
jgi:hypothetical protein